MPNTRVAVCLVLANVLLYGAAGRAEELKPFEYADAHIAFYPPKDAPGLEQEAPAKMQLPVSPEESIKHLRLPDGFHAELFAAEPDIVKVLAMNWDARGRLWIAESVDYPNDLKPPPDGRDRIKICEDSNGDGRADRFTIFADHLSIPTSLVFANGGLIVAQAPDTLVLQDTDGDDVADLRRVLFTGWGTTDTHSGPSNFRLGLDNWIWGTVGYSGFDGTVGGKALKFRMGVIRFKPDGSALEFVSPTDNNTWGLGLSETGDIFVSTANGNHMDHMAIPNRYYESVAGYTGTGIARIFDHDHIRPITNKVRQVDWHGQFTAAAGAALYTARAYPESYWNRVAFVCEPTGHLVHQCLLEHNGSGFVAHDGENLLASDDEWTAPIAAEVGPDGMVWVSDWYNYIVQHNPTPQGFENGPGNAYVTPLRDKTHGRVYRIVYGDGKPTDLPNLANATNDALAEALGNSNLFWRTTAQRLIVERNDPAIEPALIECARDTTLDAIGNAPGALHALAALDGLGFFDTGSTEAKALIVWSLRHPGPAVRRRAAHLASRMPAIDYAIDGGDPDPQVRLDALLTLTEVEEDSDIGAAMAFLVGDPEIAADPWLSQAVVMVAARHCNGFLDTIPTILFEQVVPDTILESVMAVANHYARSGGQTRLAKHLGYFSGAPDALETAWLRGLAAGWPEGAPPALSSELKKELADLDQRLTPEQVVPALALARAWNAGDAFHRARETFEVTAGAILVDPGQSDEARGKAAAQLAQVVPGATTRNVILAQATAQASPDLTAGLFEALRNDSADETAADILAHFTGLPPKALGQAIDTLLSRRSWSLALLDAMDGGAVPRPAFSVVQKRLLLDSADADLRKRAEAVLLANRETVNADRDALVQRLMPLTRQSGDASLGKQTFAENCMPCHRFNGEGGTVAPDLTGIAGGDRSEILTAIIDPNRSVEANFHQWSAETRDGLIFSGKLAEETQTSIVIYDALGKPHTILREDIEELTMSPLSVMPEGFEALPEDALRGLLEYLVTGSAFAPLDLREAANTVSTEPMFTNGKSNDPFQNRLVFDTWGRHVFDGVPYTLIDPEGTSIPNAIMLHSPHSPVVEAKPRSATVPCNRRAKAIHLLSGVSGWGYPFGENGSTTMIVRLHYADGNTEEHPLLNGVHFADYIRVIEVPESRLAFELGGRQLRQLTIRPQRSEVIQDIEFRKGEDDAAPVVMAVTVELPDRTP